MGEKESRRDASRLLPDVQGGGRVSADYERCCCNQFDCDTCGDEWRRDYARAIAIDTCRMLANIGTGVLIAHLAERATLYARCATEFALDVMRLAPKSLESHQLAVRWMSLYAPPGARP